MEPIEPLDPREPSPPSAPLALQGRSVPLGDCVPSAAPQGLGAGLEILPDDGPC